MPFLCGQVIFLRVQRILELLSIVFFIILLYIIYSRWSLRSNNELKLHRIITDNLIINENNDETIKELYSGRPDLAKYIHLDLKGAPPKADKFYESFFEFLETLQMGVKGVIIEYEDTLPLEGNLANIINRIGYSRSDIQLIQDSAKNHQLEIIPLIQTFGHLEWILKLDEYKSYRDDPDLPTVISPCLDETYILLEDLLRQTLDMHPDSNTIHIGCDEVILKNSHEQCYQTQMNKFERYINHIQRIINILRKIRPGIRILIWDDILRDDQLINNEKLLNQLKGLIEPVSWNYFPTFDNRYKSLSAWNIYPKFFMNIWAASAFKGGLHRYSILTNTTHHVLNNHQWLHFMQSSNFRNDSFSAIILTGWSRFDHFMPLCDLLPTAYPSLIYSLYILNTDKYLVDNSIYNCERLLKSIGKNSGICESLPGISIWSGISSLSILLLKIQNRLKILNTIAPEYNRKQLFVRRSELDSRLRELHILQKDLFSSKIILNGHLMDLYSEDVVNEWFELYLTPIANQIDAIFVEFSSARNKTSWPRRPLMY